MYRYKSKERTLDIKTREGVFYPTDTTEVLIAASLKAIKKPGRFLDLGCGSGIIGIVLAKSGLLESPFYASDLSLDAVALAEENARDHGCAIVAKMGSLFGPWSGEKFDVIVDDVPGITEEVLGVSKWFTHGVPCAAGKDGNALVSQVVREAPKYLTAEGVLIFPVLSLSDTDTLLDEAKKSFKRVDRVLKRMWALPDTMKSQMDFLRKLEREKKIRLEEKFGMTLWYTEVYAATNA